MSGLTAQACNVVLTNIVAAFTAAFRIDSSPSSALFWLVVSTGKFLMLVKKGAQSPSSIVMIFTAVGID